jgi:hypothetical protein
MNCRWTAIVIVVGIGVAAISTSAPAQNGSSKNRLLALRIQNAYQQQQIALESAVQQTELLAQQAIHQTATSEPSIFSRPLAFQAQQSALQLAQAQTRALSQITMSVRSLPNQTVGLQLAGLEAALQRTASLEAAAQIQNGQLTIDQVQSLFIEQANLMNLLAYPAPNARGTPTR